MDEAPQRIEQASVIDGLASKLPMVQEEEKSERRSNLNLCPRRHHQADIYFARSFTSIQDHLDSDSGYSFLVLLTVYFGWLAYKAGPEKERIEADRSAAEKQWRETAEKTQVADQKIAAYEHTMTLTLREQARKARQEKEFNESLILNLAALARFDSIGETAERAKVVGELLTSPEFPIAFTIPRPPSAELIGTAVTSRPKAGCWPWRPLIGPSLVGFGDRP
jgi:hypothetical protein